MVFLDIRVEKSKEPKANDENREGEVMATNQAFEALFKRFGTDPFQIDRMASTMVEDLAELAGIHVPTFLGKKSQIGKWLSARNRDECILQNGQRVRLVLRRPGTGHPAAIYQLTVIGSH